MFAAILKFLGLTSGNDQIAASVLKERATYYTAGRECKKEYAEWTGVRR